MKETNVAGADYQIGKLDAFKQFHIFAKLAPIFASLGAGASEFKELPVSSNGERDLGPVLKVFAVPLANAIADMNDEQRDKLIYVCLGCVSKKVNGQWAPVKASGSNALMFADIDGATLMMLTFEVIKENLSGFFSLLQREGFGGEEPKA
jgi:hypothetical protein